MATTDELLQKGIQAARAGQSAEARHILKQIVEQDPRHETAWLWLSGVVETDEQRLTCLENVLAVNPHHQVAQRGLALLRQKAAAIKPLPEATPEPVLSEAEGPPQVITAPPPPPSPPIMSKPRAKKSSPWATVGLVALIMLVVGLWCNNKWNAIFGTTTYTATPDPLEECRLLLPSYLKDGMLLVGQFEDDAELASNTARIALAPIVQRLQDTYREYKVIPPPDCATKLHARTSEWMDWTIQGFHAFMAQDEVTAKMCFQKASDAKKASLTELDRLPDPGE